jgi:sulfite reductase beta subunit-like hemoprotein
LDTKIETLELIREDVERAIAISKRQETYFHGVAIGMVCPIFQALARNGLQPINCGSERAALVNGTIALDDSAQEVTSMSSSNWFRLLAREFPITFTIYEVSSEL